MHAFERGNTCIYKLAIEEYRDPVYKNSLLREDDGDQANIAFLLDEHIAEEEIFFEALDSEKRSKLMILYALGQRNNFHMRQLSYGEAFSLCADRIVGIVFPKELIRQSGSFHVGFYGTDILEFLCRMLSLQSTMDLTAECVFADTKPQNSDMEERKEEVAFTHAYLIRQHMEQLRREHLLDTVLQKTSELMLQEDCFTLFQQYLNFFLENPGEYEKLAGFTAPFLILRGDNTCGGVLRQFADDLAEALARNGQIVHIITGEEKEDEDLASYAGKSLKGIVGFQTPVLESTFCRNLCAPKFQFWFDNPFSFQGVLRDLPDDHYVLCQDGDHAEWIRKYYHTQNALQFPPGGMDAEFFKKCVNKERKSQGYGGQEKNRDADLVFMGRYFPDETDGLSDLQRSFYDHMIAHPTLNFEEGILSLYGENVVEDVPKKLFAVKAACRAVVGHFRCMVVETILRAGISIHVYGKEWKDYTGEGKENLIIHPEVSMRESCEIFRRAKIGLSVMSWYKAGMTERIANIMLSGAVCLSDETRYLREHTTNGEDILLYRLDELEKLPMLIRGILDNEKERKGIADRAYEKAVNEFGWNARSRELIELAERFLNPSD